MPTTRITQLRLGAATIAVLALGFGVAACGGGDESDEPAPVTTTTTTDEAVAITQAELIESGDAICDEANSALGSIEASTADETTKADQISGIYDGLAAQLGELGTPSDGDPPTEVIAAAQDLADGSGDTTALQTAATEYGFTECAEPPSATATSVPTEPGSTSSGTESTETYTPPTTESTETYTPPATPAPPTTGGGVAPTPPDTGGSSGSSGGSSSGGIGPG